MNSSLLYAQSAPVSAACSRNATPCNLRTSQPCSSGRSTTANAPLLASPLQYSRRPQRQCRMLVASTSLDDLSLFPGGSESSSSLEAPSQSSSSRKGASDFQKADDITRAALIVLAGPGAVKRNWVYFSGAQSLLTSCVADLCAVLSLRRVAAAPLLVHLLAGICRKCLVDHFRVLCMRQTVAHCCLERLHGQLSSPLQLLFRTL